MLGGGNLDTTVTTRGTQSRQSKFSTPDLVLSLIFQVTITVTTVKTKRIMMVKETGNSNNSFSFCSKLISTYVELGKPHTSSAPYIGSLPKVALETVPMFVWLIERSFPISVGGMSVSSFLHLSFLHPAINVVMLWHVHHCIMWLEVAFCVW